MLYVLSRLFYRHTLVHTLNRTWSTMYTDSPLDAESLHDKCDIHLVYLGEYMYGELRPLPMIPPPNAVTAPEKYPITKQCGIPKKALDLRVPSVKCVATTELNMVEEQDQPCCSSVPQHTSMDEPKVPSTNIQQCDNSLSGAAVECSASENTELPKQQHVPDQLQCCTIPDDNYPVSNEAGYTSDGSKPVSNESDGRMELPKSSTEPDTLENPNKLGGADNTNQPQSPMNPDRLNHERRKPPGQDNIAVTKQSDQSGTTLTETTSLISVGCSDQSGDPVVLTSLDSPVTRIQGEPTEVCLNRTGTELHVSDKNNTPVHDSINVIPDSTDIPSLAKMEPVPKLRFLAGKTLRRSFPGMDYLDIAKAIDKFNQNKLFQPTRLSVLCYKELETRFDIVTINKGLEVIKQTTREVPTLPNIRDECNFNKYLKALALKRKVSVTVQKLCTEIIKLQTKTHWTNIDPYSDIEEISSETDEGQIPSQASQTQEPSGLLFECHGGHVL